MLILVLNYSGYYNLFFRTLHVFFSRLSAKIKTAETDLNLINKYLQQLSQSYRYQIENMKTRLNKTFQTMATTSWKTIEVVSDLFHIYSYLFLIIKFINNNCNLLPVSVSFRKFT